jgi:hypothetical protein
MKWHEWLAMCVLLLPTLFFFAMCIFIACEPLAGTFQRRRGMSGG